MISEVYDALREAGASDEAARKAAEAVAQSDVRFTAIDARLIRIEERLGTMVTKADLEAVRGATKADLEALRGATRTDLEAVRGTMGALAAKADLEALRGAMGALAAKADLEALRGAMGALATKADLEAVRGAATTDAETLRVAVAGCATKGELEGLRREMVASFERLGSEFARVETRLTRLAFTAAGLGGLLGGVVASVAKLF
jgi:hypothetical protein